ncbi:hypothetical protein HAX54_039591 [Datura stramonium]|uniref:Trichome birefringence-like C-terminal domain-containing protein n=1 Tax=Datura stramonium TaxID=4076 RepID=A0ABS8VLH5_DATST|nr:hypothetical protein [Datura stramonium]
MGIGSFSLTTFMKRADDLIGCVYCGEAGVQDLGSGYAIRRAFQAAFNYINKCVECSCIVVLLRTCLAGQFDHGAWNEVGLCNNTDHFPGKKLKLVIKIGNLDVFKLKKLR